MKHVKVILCVMFLMGIMHVTVNATTILNTYDVDAYEHSLANTPLNTNLYLNVGDYLSISVKETDLWGAGKKDRISNANGLGPDNPYGGTYPLYEANGASFYYGSLVGQIDGGDYFLVGTSYADVVETQGFLKLLYWDNNYHDNFEFVTATVEVQPVPEPSTLLLLFSGFFGIGLVGWYRRRR